MIDHPSKFFIIGDMLELGIETKNEHDSIGQLLEKLAIKGYSVGNQFLKVKSENLIVQFNNCEEAARYFEIKSFSDNLIILKGSRGIGLENLESLF